MITIIIIIIIIIIKLVTPGALNSCMHTFREQMSDLLWFNG